jgi:hypothetical protein
MKNYLSALKHCYENGDFVKSRAGNVQKSFGYQMRFDCYFITLVLLALLLS